ncbi:MAG: hypothetical protein ACTS73_07545 [Arsenophonus sp. NEOnobi-MAG3]
MHKFIRNHPGQLIASTALSLNLEAMLRQYAERPPYRPGLMPSSITVFPQRIHKD